MSAPILVIGATGRHGGTGLTVVDWLLSRGRPVRALVRTDDERAEALRRRGATTVIADLHDRASLAMAVQDVSAVYFTYPVAAGVVSAAANLTSVLSEMVSKPHLVVMSMAVSSVGSPSRLGQAQAVAEEIFTWAGLNPTVLRFGGLFHENVLLLHGATIRQDGVIANSFGQGPAPWIGGDDAAEIAAAHLLAPPPDSARISYPPPAEVIDHVEVARIISAETGRPVRFEPISAAAWRTELEAAAQADPNSPINVAMAQHISTIGGALAQRSESLIPPDPDALAAMLDRPPTPLAEFVRRNLPHFAPSTPATMRT
ncbi:NmrA family NAD(P)-binding protein [Mycobacterium sp. Aquia_216]|uniref:NmrA family NAD(P)-binding protein n=1 Tax=Mycobacterium sp. Aquia_216 TaxID=2991729 RepID=UPI00227BE2B9|nr:NmrA family NAD(P)-binding protein [Mycobacterium sp. Aquia_216]WAJ44998.1 NmrA family NAD(P)-binding protein [Mycobacterium sp. Aquia_216]